MSRMSTRPTRIRRSAVFGLFLAGVLPLAPTNRPALAQAPVDPAPPAQPADPESPAADDSPPVPEPSGAPATPVVPPADPDAGQPASPVAPDAGQPASPVAPDVAQPAPGAEPGADGAPAAAPAPTAEPPKLEPGADARTGVAGRVVDRRTGQPLPLAPVLARGSDNQVRSTLSDDNGQYKLLVPPGLYVVRSYFDLYHGARFDRVRVTRGGFTGINLVLDPLDLNDEVVVQEIEIPYRADTTTAAAQDQLRKESRGIGEGMGAKQMSQQGASDAAAAARRVVGVTIDDSQLVVRGLGGRYVKVFLNGLPVPNTDPDFPSVDLDLFPTNVIDSLNVQKVFQPDIPADFAGGTLDINTVSFPRQFTLEAGVGTTFNSQTTFRDRLTHKGGKYDFLGFDDGTRALPRVVDGVKLSRQGFPDPAAQEAASEQFKNIWNLDRTSGLPKLGLDLTIGDSKKFGNRRRFGYLASLVYDYSVERQVGVTRPKPGVLNGEAIERSHYDVESASENVQLAAIGTASLDLGADHSITALTMFNRSMEDQTRYRKGINGEVNAVIPYEQWQLKFLARSMWVNQLLGDHRNLGGTRLRLRWSGYHALGTRDEPDQRTVAYGESNGLVRGWRPSASRLWSDLSQNDMGGNTSLRFPLWVQAWGTLGGRLTRSDRDFNNRSFDLLAHQNNMDAMNLAADPETIFSPAGLGTVSKMNESTRPVDSYRSKQRAYDAYALVETPVLGGLSAAGGARLEAFNQEVSSFSPFAMDNTPEKLMENRTDRSDLDILPGAALKYTISETMLIRAAYGKTLSRPQVRELAPYGYYDFLRDRIVSGNPLLKTASIQNADLRWEWFFGEGQILSVSGFYKKFKDPIELQIINPDTQDSQYQNAKGATSLGAEFELRSELAALTNVLRKFNAGANLTLINSKIELNDSGAVRSNRRLSGQAPYVVNLSLRYSDSDTRLSSSLVYNVVGPRITDVGTRSNNDILPDIEEQAFHSLDYIGSWGISKNLKLKLKARNLLFQKKTLKQGSLIAQRMNAGVSVSLGLSYEY